MVSHTFLPPFGTQQINTSRMLSVFFYKASMVRQLTFLEHYWLWPFTRHLPHLPRMQLRALAGLLLCSQSVCARACWGTC